MALRTYFADAVFTFSLQSGDWKDCDDEGALAVMFQDLQAALWRGGGQFTYTDLYGREVDAAYRTVTAPVPCGDMPPEPEMHGLVSWRANGAPQPGEGWDLGAKLAAWLTGVPYVSQGVSVMINVKSLWVQESSSNQPGVLWPAPPEASQEL